MLGESVSLHGDLAAVGPSRAEDCEAEAVYICRQSDGLWVQDSRLTAPEIETKHLFGASVSIRDNVLLVGAPFYRDSQAPGSVYRFDWDGREWVYLCGVGHWSVQLQTHLSVVGCCRRRKGAQGG